MNQQRQDPVKDKLINFIAVQIMLVVIASSFWLIQSQHAFYSSVIGGGICVIANYYFARKLFSVSGARNARKIVNSLYVGEGIKLLITAVLFSAVFKWGRVVPLPLFAGFIAAQMVVWLAPWVLNKKNK